MDETVRTNIRAAAGVFAVIVVLLVGYFIYTAISQSGKMAVKIHAVPSDARVTLNGVEVTSSGTTYLQPGDYELKATKEGFEDFTNNVTINTPNMIVTAPLTPVSEEAKKWADEHKSDYMALEADAGVEAQQQGEAFRTANPIVNLLPYRSLLYTIGYRADPADPDSDAIIIEIDASEGYRQQAIYQIQQWGYDPTDFKINFRDYKNPFAS